jgi:hypothetical protein
VNGHSQLVNQPPADTCQARLPLGAKPREEVTPSGWLMYSQTYCTQTVGLRRWTDLTGRGRAACPLAGHLGDVAMQANADELTERVRHDCEQDARPLSNDFRELVAIRPELAGRL